jgi:hypothetical protein
VRGELYNPLAVYRFLDAFTKSLTIDTQLGGITGLYDLGQSLRAIPASKIAFFTLPNYTDPNATANVLWTEPEDSQIFASFRDDVPASSSLFAPSAAPAAKASSTSAAGRTLSTSPSTAASPSSSPSPGVRSLPIQDRTASQSICAG